MLPVQVNNFGDFPNGLFLIDKPLEWTSFDVVNKIRRFTRIKKVGHGGTLDPMATGLLVIATGNMTRQLSLIQESSKAYSGTIKLGYTTASFDSETEAIPFENARQIHNIELHSCILSHFTGPIKQKPPIYSAIKKGGKKLYEYARENKTVDIENRDVIIYQFEASVSENQIVTFYIECSKGTYIRSLANDLGLCLQTGGFLQSLRREKVGDFHIDQAFSLNDFLETVKPWIEQKT